MTGAIIGLIGAVVGAVTALVGSTLSDHRRTRQEAMKWQRDQRTAAYEGALRHLLRASKVPSKIGTFDSDPMTFGQPSDEHQKDWLNELAEAQFWLHLLASRCEPAQSAQLGDWARRLDDAIRSMTTTMSSENVKEVREALADAVEAVSRCAQLHMTSSATEPMPAGISARISSGAD